MPRGPRSPTAKARVSKNAVRHGLRSTAVVIPGLERQEDWEQFLRESIDYVAPVGPIEYALAERIAALLWRLRRAWRAERDAALIPGNTYYRDNAGPGPAQIAERIVAIQQSIARQLAAGGDGLSGPGEEASSSTDAGLERFASSLPPPHLLQTYSKYEYRLSRQLRHAFIQLHELEDRRNGVYAPAARLDVDVHGLPGSD